jgi:antitoxin component of MazEF toxin-antitoxin module
MTSGSFVIEIQDNKKINIPPEITNHLHLQEGDKVEVVIKKIRSKRLDIKISKNPLVKLLNLSEEQAE